MPGAEGKPSRSIPWRRWNSALHRDIGYLVVGLSLVYGISGIALNHAGDWNPNYVPLRKELKLEPVPSGITEDEAVARILSGLKEQEKPKSAYRVDDDTLQIFFREKTVSVDLPSGRVLVEGSRPRPVLYALNRLHLNAPKRHWTWIADFYGVALVFLAVSGLFILRGRQGIAGRGAWLTGIGALVPLAYWLWFSAR